MAVWNLVVKAMARLKPYSTNNCLWMIRGNNAMADCPLLITAIQLVLGVGVVMVQTGYLPFSVVISIGLVKFLSFILFSFQIPLFNL